MNISAADVKTLREKTNAPFMDCKAALTEANGDMDKAIEILRKKNAGIRAKKGERETAEGRVAVFIDSGNKVGVILELRCESAPVAKNDLFVKLADDLARHIAMANPASVEDLVAQPFSGDPKRTVNERVDEVVGLIRENMKPARFVRLTGLLAGYSHHDGRLGVLLQVEGDNDNQDLLRGVCMHIAAKNPVAARREDVAADVIEKEKEIARAQAQATGKPANIVERIAEGKIKTWLAENVLLDQPYVKDDSKTVGELLKQAGFKLMRYVRYQVGDLS
jgi:elongation factor Ts